MASNQKEGREMDDSVIDKGNTDTTDQMKDVITDGSGQTVVKEKEDDKPIMGGKKIIGPGFGNIFKDGPIKLRTRGDREKLVPDKTTENKVIERNIKDGTFVQDSPRTSWKGMSDNCMDVAKDGPGQSSVNKIAKPPIKNKPLIAGRKSMGDGVGNNVESGPEKRHTAGAPAKPVSGDKPIENKGQGGLKDDPCLNSVCEVEQGSDFIEEYLDTTNQGVLRPESACIDLINYADLGNLLTNLNMKVTSFDDDKLKLKQRMFSGQRIHSFSQKIKEVLIEKVQNYKGLKKMLLELNSNIIETVGNEAFKENMSEVTELRFPHYEEELESFRTVLQNMTEHFEIVVSGETSSGKSTFLNVLLGEKILPSHHLHTTASLCRLHNSENRRIECIVENRIIDSISLTADSSDLREKLESITKRLLSNDGEDETLKSIDIYWPISSLHEHVVLVDTPGIGERDALTRQVVEYIPKSAGYIFIVDSSRAGGVQDSGIRKLIEAIAVSASKDDHIKDLSNAIFVCNKWDQVKISERDVVLENTKQKLRKQCGQLGEWQIVPFNADLELKLLELKANPTDDFKILLTSLETLMIRTIGTRLRDTYRWLHKFAMEVKGLLTVKISATELSKEKVQLEIRQAGLYLDLANKELEKCNEVEAMIDQEENLLLQALEEYLKSADVQRKHFDWTNCAPELIKVEEDGPALIIARLQDAILEWATAETSPLKQASVRTTDKCKKIQAEIDERIMNLNNLELGFSFSKSSGQSDSLSSDESEILSGRGIAIVLASNPIWITVGLVALVVGLIPVLNWAINLFAQGKTKSIKIMTKMTEKAIYTLKSENHLKQFITDSFTAHYSKWLNELKEDAQRITESTRVYMLRIEKDLYKNMVKLQVFKQLQDKLNQCSNSLHELGKDI